MIQKILILKVDLKNKIMSIEANIKSLKIWKNDISIEAIDGGLTNQNF